MVSQIPGPLELDPALWKKDPVLKAIFLEVDEFTHWLGRCRSLQNALAGSDSDELFGLLIADHKEKTFFGSEMDGEIVRRDVQKQAVYFENPRILVPAPDLDIARKQLQHRILVMLFTRELKEIADLNALKEELEKQQDHLELTLWVHDKPESGNTTPADAGKTHEAEGVLKDIDREIEKIGKDLNTPESHLTHVTQALMSLGRHLQIKRFNLRLNSLGVKVKASSREPFSEITLAECTFTGSTKRAAIWARYKRSLMKESPWPRTI